MTTNRSDRRSLFIIAAVFIFVITGTFIVSLFARGYQISFQKNGGPQLQSTGILSLSSEPKGASVYIDDRLITATDDTLNLSPGNYSVKIVKDGYLPWQKNIQIKKETVYAADVQLFRSVPDLLPLTLSGAINPTVSPDFSKIIFAVASASAQKDNGLYLIQLADNPLNLTRNSPRQIAPDFPGLDWSKAKFTFSPDSRSVLVTLQTNNENFLLDLNSAITQTSLTDVTLRLPIIKADWQQQELTLTASRLDILPAEIRPLVASTSAQSIALSSSNDLVLYLAAVDGSIPDHLISPPPAQSTQIQSRQIKAGFYYVYDTKDDTNFLIGDNHNVSELAWIPNTDSLIFIENNSIMAIEYDGTNKQTIFAGSLTEPIAYPWADGSRIITLTAPYTGATENLYTISLK